MVSVSNVKALPALVSQLVPPLGISLQVLHVMPVELEQLHVHLLQ